MHLQQPVNRTSVGWAVACVHAAALSLLLVVLGCGSDEAPSEPSVEPGPELFRFLPGQSTSSPIPAPMQLHTGDVDGDRRADLIWNHKSPASNQMFVGRSGADGMVAFGAASNHSQSVGEGWDAFETLIGRLNGDALSDLAWNHRARRNKMWFAFADGSGNWDFMPQQERAESSWRGFVVLLADVNGDGIEDWVWNETTAQANRIFVGINEIIGFTTFLGAQALVARDWSSSVLARGDLNGDGRHDLIWNELTPTGNCSFVGLADGNGRFTFSGESARSGTSQAFRFHVGDVDGDGLDDQIWEMASSAGGRVAVSLSNGDGTFEHLSLQEVAAGAWPAPPECHVADVDADGRADLIWNALGSSNRVVVGLGTATGRFDFAATAQEHPTSIDWSAFSLSVADLDGDARADLIWNDASALNRIYVALAKRP